MKTTRTHISQSIQELSFVLVPPGHIRSDVSVLKDDVQFLIGHPFPDRYTPAHIALFRFDLEPHFGDITRFVEDAARGFEPFNIFLKNLGAAADGSARTIFLNVVDTYAIREMFGRLVKRDIGFKPRLVIASNLSTTDFASAWPYLRDLDYNQHFVCDRIRVMARAGNRWVYQRDLAFGG
jgi:hypothetical protein